MNADDRIELVHAFDDLISFRIVNHIFVLHLKGLADIGNRNGEDGFSNGNLHAIHDGHGQRDF
ncbi:hypothetical protein D3C81_2315910 [compost metagenome]